MRKFKLGVVGFLIMFLVFQVSVVVAEESDELIEGAIGKLEAAQSALEGGKQEEAYSLLEDVKAQVTKVMFPFMPEETNRQILVNDFLIKPAEDFFEFKESFFSNDYYHVSTYFVIENLTNKKRDVTWDYYLIDPSGIQRSGSTYGEFHVLGGAKVIQSFNLDVKKGKFELGIYTFYLLPKGANKMYTFKLPLSEDKL